MARLIGEAYISLLPDAALFRTMATSEVNKATAGIRGTVKLTADASDIDKKVAAIAAALKGLKGNADLKFNARSAITTLSQLDAALTALRERADNIPLDMNDTKGLAKLYTLLAGIDDLEKRAGNVDADFNLNRAIGKLYTMETGVKALEDAAKSMRADFNTAEANAALAELGAGVTKVSKSLDDMRANVTDSAALAKIIAMQAQALKLAKQLDNLPVTADTLPFQASLFKLAAEVEAFQKKLEVKITPVLGGMAGAQALIASRQYGLGAVSPKSAQSAADAGLTALAAANAFANFNKPLRETAMLSPIVAAGLGKILATNRMIIGDMNPFTAGWGSLTAKIRLFGGALDSVLPHFLASVSVWHLGVDAILELAAAWGPAIIAVATFAGVAYPTAQKIAGQWQNINTIIDGVGGKSLPDLGKGFDTLSRAIQPSLMIAFGEYMLTIGRNVQPLGDALAKVGQVIDVWGAKLVGWADHARSAFTNIVSVGAKDFAQIGYGFQQVFRIIGSLIKDLPGYVHTLLTIGDAFLTITANAVQFLGPVLKIGLALHGFILYVGLAVTAVLALSRAMTTGALITFADKMGLSLAAVGVDAKTAGANFNKFGTAIGSFAGGLAAAGVKTAVYAKAVGGVAKDSGPAAVWTKIMGDAIKVVPFGAAGLAALGFAAVLGGALYVGLKLVTDNTVKFDEAMQRLIASSNAGNIGQNLTVALQKTTQQINLSLQGSVNAQQQYNKAVANIPVNVSQAQAQSVKNILKNQEQLTAAANTGNKQMQTAAANTTSVYQQLSTAQQQIITQGTTYGSRMAQLAGVFGSVGAAQSALNLVGISAGTIAKETNAQYATQLTELQALAKGYGYMGSQSGAAGAQLNALNISTGTVTKNIHALTQAESAWITMITGGESAFVTFEQGFPALTSAMGKAAASAPTVTIRLGSLRETFSALGATMTGITPASLAVRQAFDSQLSAGVTLYGNLQTLATASGNTGKAQYELAKSGKDIIAQLLPFAAGSKQATAEVSSLAQLMGGPATDSFQTLAKWVGNTKGAEADLNTEQAKLTISAANLTTAEKNLGNAIETSITSAEAAAIVKTADFGNAVTGLSQAAATARGQVTQAALLFSGEFYQSMLKTGIGTTNATQQLNAYLKQLGYGPDAIKAIDSQLGASTKALNKYVAQQAQGAATAKNFAKATSANSSAFQQLQSVLPGTIQQQNLMWQALLKQDAAMVASGKSATGAKSQFINFATQGLQLTERQAQALWTKFGGQNLDMIAGKAATTKTAFLRMAEDGLHISAQQAQALWGKFALQNLDMIVTKGNTAKGMFINLARNGLDLTASQAQALWNTMRNQYLDTLAHKAGETEAQFIKTAKSFGDTTAQAEALWKQLHNVAGNYKANIAFTVSGGGHVTVNGTVSISAGTLGPGVSVANAPPNKTQAAQNLASGLTHRYMGGKIPEMATGGKVPGWHNTGDNTLAVSPSGPIALQGGEAIVPKNLATHPAFAGFAKDHGIPGYAGGGILNANVGGLPIDPSAGSRLMAKYQEPGFINKTATQLEGQVAQALGPAIKTAASNAQAAALAGGAYNGPAHFGGGFESISALLAFARYFMANGLSRAAAAGMAATISGEENSLGPESVGSGGFGLIGWTGNTIGLPPGYTGPTGNVAYDLAAQLRGVIGYMNSRGGPGPLNAAGDPVAAGNVWSRYEAPLVPLSDTRPAIAQELYALLGGPASSGAQVVNGAVNGGVTSGNGGGVIANGYSYARGGRVKAYSTGGVVNEPVYGQGAYSGLPYSFAENGQPEFVSNAGQAASGPSMMQPITTYQGKDIVSALNYLITLWKQFPQAIGSAVSTGTGNGVKHGYYGAQN